MKVKLPITHIEEVDIPDKVFFQYIKEKFQKAHPTFDFRSYITNEGKLKVTNGYDGYSYDYRTKEATLEDIALINLWQQIREIYEPPWRDE
jgi:hypothetical protein